MEVTLKLKPLPPEPILSLSHFEFNHIVPESLILKKRSKVVLKDNYRTVNSERHRHKKAMIQNNMDMILNLKVDCPINNGRLLHLYLDTCSMLTISFFSFL